MSGNYPYGGPPPYGPPPPWGHPHPPPPPHHTYPPHPYPYPYPPHDGGQTTVPDAPPMGAIPYFVPGMMIPVPLAPMPPAPQDPQVSQPTYVTNYIYHGASDVQTQDNQNQVSVVETSGEFDWLPITATTANTLTGKAVLGGNEGWDGSPLWVIRAWHNGDLVPGKLSVRHHAASIVHDGKEVSKQNIEVLCASPHNLRWVPASNGSVPPGAIPGGRTTSGETLYVGRARHQLSITPGKVHPSHNCCYIGFAGQEVSHKIYDVLCRVS